MSESISSESLVDGSCVMIFSAHGFAYASYIGSRNITNPAASIVADANTAATKLVLLISSLKRRQK
jgi:hypothetical protein